MRRPGEDTYSSVGGGDTPPKIEWQLIGGVGLSVDGLRRPIEGHRQREILALLLTRPGVAVSIDSVAEELWGETQPKTARKSVQRFVADVRRSLGAHAHLLQTRDQGYQLDVLAEDIDVGRAAEFATRAKALTNDPEAAYELLREAVDVLDGAAFYGLRQLSFVELARAEVEEARVRSSEQLASVEVELGLADDALSRLRGLVAVHPFRETATGQLMRTLYDLGRQNEALDAYESLRDALAEELGLEPSPELRLLQGQILCHEVPAIGSPTQVVHDVQLVLPSELGSLGGEPLHTATFTKINAEIDDAVAGQRDRVFLIGGEPGSGKTHLLARLAKTRHDQGWCILHGRCSDSGDWLYPAWSSVVGQLLTLSPALLAHEALEPLIEIFGASAESSAVTKVVGGTSSALTRGETYSQVAAAVNAVAAQLPVLVVLDDLQWASLSSLDLLTSLAAQAGDGLVILGAFRDNEEASSHPLAGALTTPGFASRTTVVHLPSLTVEDTGVLLNRFTSVTSDVDLSNKVRAIHRRSGGNAFFAAELIRSTSADQNRPMALQGTPGTESLPSSIRPVVGARVEQLGPDVAELLRSAALLGRDFSASLLTAMLGIRPQQVEAALETAVRAQLVVESSDSLGHFRFAHDLVREILVDDLSQIAAARLHGRAADVLIVQADNDAGSAAQTCRHLLAAKDPDRAPDIVRFAHLAGSHASARFAYAEARTWFETALEHLATVEQEDPHQLLKLTVDLGREMRRMGDQGYRAKLLEAGDMAHELGADDIVIEVVKSNNVGAHSESFAVDDERLQQLRRALGLVREGSADHGLLLALLSVETTFVSTLAERLQTSAHSVAIAREVGDPALLCQVLNLRHTAIQFPSTHAVRLVETAEAIELVSALSDLTLQWWARDTRTRALSEAGRFAEAGTQIDAMESVSRVLGQPLLDWMTNWHRAAWLLATDQLAEADHFAKAARSIGLSIGEPDTHVTFAAFAAGAMVQSGRAANLVEPLRGQLARADNASQRAMLAFCLTDLHDPEAVQVLQPDIDNGFTSFDQDMTWSTSMAMCAETAAQAGLTSACRELYGHLAPHRGLMAHSGPVFFGPIDRVLGLLAAALGDPNADSYFDSAADSMKLAGSEYWLARVHLDMVNRSVQHQATDDTAYLQSKIEQAARRLGSPWLLAESERRGSATPG